MANLDKRTRCGSQSPTWKGGLPICSGCGKKLSRYDAKKCHSCCKIGNKNGFKTGHDKGILPKNYLTLNKSLGGLNSRKILAERKPTCLEIKVYNTLKEKGFLFETQKLINGKFLVDAYIPSLNLVIEADGDYWHKLDRIVKKDKAENAYLIKCGYNLLRLSENEIKNGTFINKLEVQSV